MISLDEMTVLSNRPHSQMFGHERFRSLTGGTRCCRTAYQMGLCGTLVNAFVLDRRGQYWGGNVSPTPP